MKRKLTTEQKLRKVIRRIIKESKRYPYQINDMLSRKLYDKYDKAMGDDNWVDKVDLHRSDNYEQHIPLDKFLKKSGMTIKELMKLSDYGDESWDLYIDNENNILYIYHD